MPPAAVRIRCICHNCACAGALRDARHGLQLLERGATLWPCSPHVFLMHAVHAYCSCVLLMQAAAQRSVDSKANGALMRATPLAIWAHRQDDAAIAEAAAADARLSHANPTCQDCNAAYCIALARLIRCPGDSAGAIARSEAWAQQHAAGEEVRGRGCPGLAAPPLLFARRAASPGNDIA